ncbi:MAG: MerR family transcriptional regulator [Actinomycetota bacterium]
MTENGPAAPLSIGRLARESGLSVKAIRHYERTGLLAPHEVDPATGYRRYTASQVETARTIRRLRDLDVPLARIRTILADGDAETSRRELAEHLARTEAESWRLQRIVHRLRRTIDDGDEEQGREQEMADRVEATTKMEPGEERSLATGLFNETWTLLEKTDRDRSEDDRMIHIAHASRFHWGNVGEPENLAIGEWQISRVYAVLGRAEPSLYHANRSLEICLEHGIGDFPLAYAYEALARGHLVAGDRAEATRFTELANEAGDGIAEEEDRELLRQDLEAIAP